MKPMKIKINNQCEVCLVSTELERLGYKKRCITVGKPRFITTECNGYYDVFFIDYYGCRELTTLAELKEM